MFTAVILPALGAIRAQAVDLSEVSVANVSSHGFTAVWRTSEASVPGIDLFSDAAGTMSLAGIARVEFSPLGLGDLEAGSTFEARAVRRALQEAMAARLLASARVTGLTAGATVYFRPRSQDENGADNGGALLPLTAVTLPDRTGFVLDNRILAVQFPGFAAEGHVALLHGPAGTTALAAVIGDGDGDDIALFALGNLQDSAAGRNADPTGAVPVTITVLGNGAPAGSFAHTVDFSPTFDVGSYELFTASAVSPGPVITAHPADTVVLVGATATFMVGASGDPAPDFQWQRQAVGTGTWSNVVDGANYSGATTTTLQVANTTEAMSGDQFRAIASNGVPPEATSSAATLTVNLGSSSIALSNLTHIYDGTPKSATVTTNPVGLAVTVTYNGSATAPTQAGSYAVLATITASGYSGTAAGTLTINPASQTIAFDAPSDRTFGEAPFALAATASSNLPVSFAIASGPATLAGNTVTLTGAGAVTVRATQAGDGNFTAATAVERTFNVAKATATISLGDLAHGYNGTPRGATATTTPAGLTVTLTYAGAATPPTNPGSYAVVATIVNNNYQGTATSNLVITPAPLIARADNKTKVQGAANPALTLTYIGLLAGDTAASIDAPPVAATTALLDSPAGVYPITLTGGTDNAYAITLQHGTLTITPPEDSAPTINAHPLSQSVALGDPVTLSVEASGTGPLNYQWYRNGGPLAGQTTASLAIASTTLADAGSYSVRVTNTAGQAVSQLATLTITTPPDVPTIIDQPDDLIVRRNARATFKVAASGDAPLSYQWRKGTTPIPGATSASYAIARAQPGDAGMYSVVVTNSAGTATSRDARLLVAGRSWRGIYFGFFGSNGGTCAFYIRDDNTGIFCGFARGSNIPLFTRDCRVDDDGRFRFASGPRGVLPPGMAAVESIYDFDLQIAEDGSVSGTITGLNLTVEATLSPENGATQNVAGFYTSGASNSGDVTYTILGSDGEAYAVAMVGATVDAGLGTVDAAGNVTIVTENNAVIEAVVDLPTATIASTFTPATGAAVNLSGANQDVRVNVEKLVNISTRGPTLTGDNIVITGFVVSGTQPKTVLIRAIGPTLADYNVPGVLPAAGLRLYSGTTEIASAGDWGAAENALEIAAAARRVYAFDLPIDSHDSAMLLTLQPGAYTAHIFGPQGETGVSLAEVYDATEGLIPADQRVINISTRSRVGTGADVQIAGFVIAGSVPKRVLIRGIGPTLGQYGVSGFLADPVITLHDVTGATIASNDDWGTNADVAGIEEVSAEVSAFPLTPGSKDAVLLLNLAPGVYTVLVSGADGSSGVALAEIYDAP